MCESKKFEPVKNQEPPVDIRYNICKMMSEMLDNPDENGIYPTTKFMDDMETFIGKVKPITKGLESVKWKVIRAGQPAPYKDSYYEYEVEFDGKRHKDVVRDFARFVRGCLMFADEAKKGAEGTWFMPHLTLKELPDNKWNILIVEHYTG